MDAKKNLNPIRVNFTPPEGERFSRFLERSGRKAGPYVRQLILRDLEREERLAMVQVDLTPGAPQQVTLEAQNFMQQHREGGL